MSIIDNVQACLKQIRSCEKKYSRPVGSVKLLPISKKKRVDAIKEVMLTGIDNFGESYVQEALSKMQCFNEVRLSWHFVGRIQRNKIKPIAEYFSWVHSLCSIDQAQKLNEFRPQNLPPINVLLQINLDNEVQKSGVSEDEVICLIKQVNKLSRLSFKGLMCIPSRKQRYSNQLRCFSRMKKLSLALEEQGIACQELSMGMSGDFEAAIEAGSTVVRLGTAIFGER